MKGVSICNNSAGKIWLTKASQMCVLRNWVYHRRLSVCQEEDSYSAAIFAIIVDCRNGGQHGFQKEHSYWLLKVNIRVRRTLFAFGLNTAITFVWVNVRWKLASCLVQTQLQKSHKKWPDFDLMGVFRGPMTHLYLFMKKNNLKVEHVNFTAFKKVTSQKVIKLKIT